MDEVFKKRTCAIALLTRHVDLRLPSQRNKLFSRKNFPVVFQYEFSCGTIRKFLWYQFLVLTASFSKLAFCKKTRKTRRTQHQKVAMMQVLGVRLERLCRNIIKNLLVRISFGTFRRKNSKITPFFKIFGSIFVGNALNSATKNTFDPYIAF